MCTSGENVGLSYGAGKGSGNPKVIAANDLLAVAKFLADEEGVRRNCPGFIGYSAVKAGSKVLIAVDTHSDGNIVESIARVLRDKGAKVDIITVDVGKDREFTELDEIGVIIRRKPYQEEPRRWEGIPWIQELAEKNKYDFLIHGKGGSTPNTPYGYEGIPWLTQEHFASKATVFPRGLHKLINHKAWSLIWEEGKGGTAHITDPEGTDISWTYWDEYYDMSRSGFSPNPVWGHLMGHPTPPIISKENASGVIAGTTAHFCRPFQRIKIKLDGGSIRSISGGGKYGEAWQEVMDETKNVKYPCFPGKGLFWLWEVAIGTNVKICRPSNIHMFSSGGSEWERMRSGIIHLGIGTSWRGPEEDWAGERKIAYGHLHVHLLFPTLEITNKKGQKIKVIDKGRLTALDDPEVRKEAGKYGDPAELLKEDWIPKMPGINAPGKYDDFAKDPASWIYSKK